MTGKKIKEILKNNGFSLKYVAEILGETPQNFNSMLNAQDIKTGVLERIADAIKKPLYFFYPEKTIFTNKEPILREQSVPAQQAAPSDNNTINIYIDTIKQQAEQIGALKNENENLTKQVSALQTELECLKKDNAELRDIINSRPVATQNLYELPEVPAQLVAEPQAIYGAKK